MLLVGWLACGPAFPSDALSLEDVIPLGQVGGRIDHLAVDIGRQRLFVAELGNNSVAVVDVAKRSASLTLTDFAEPQGVAYDAATDTLYVTNGGDGSVRLYSGASLSAKRRIELRDDADNIRIDPASKRIFVGFGNAIAVIDANTATFRTLPLDGHPEALQVDPVTKRLLVNVPTTRSVVSVDVETAARSRFTIPWPGANFPMAIDDDGSLLLPLRHPARLLVLTADRDRTSTAELCEDADDAFFDARRRRAYVSCGDGHLDVFERVESSYSRTDHIVTSPGARTSLFVPDWDRLFLAVPASGTSPAGIWIMRPN